MRRILKVATYASVVLVGVIVVTAGLLLTWRWVRQNANAKAYAITSPNGIDEAGYVDVGGIPQWLQVRGHDRENPVLLCVHGGPGGTWLPVTRLFAAWEKEFTVVLWDERGAGKTLSATGPAIAGTMTIDRMTQDGIEVAEHLRQRLGQEKIIVLGHSFGSILAVQMAKRRPELFHAVVGTGQVGDLPASLAAGYARLRQEAEAAHDIRSARKLAEIGPPPFTNPQDVISYFLCAEKYQPPADRAAMAELHRSLLSPPPHYSIGDELARMRGFRIVPPWSLHEEILGTKLAALGSDFLVPVFVFHGTTDQVTPLRLAEEYFENLRAPQKAFVRLEGAGHFAVWSHPELFRQELVRHVRPLAAPTKGSEAL